MMNKKFLKKILNEAVFNPKEPTGPIKIMMASKDPSYYEVRAIEFINEARELTITEHTLQVYHDKINKAISLLALARMCRS